MFSVTRSTVAICLCVAASAVCAAPRLRVCADPNNLPFSNDRQEGFENRLADMIAKDLGMDVSYFWLSQNEKFFKKSLNGGVCDIVMAVPAGFDEAETTQPYYRSTYVFISRRDRNLQVTSFDDPRLRRLRIGVHILGEQDDSLPPVHALTSRGIVRNLVGFSIFGNLTEQNPSADLIRAVVDKKVDLAIAWGPLAGYFAKNSRVPLTLTPIDGDRTHPELPFQYDIGIGVRAHEDVLKKRLNEELELRQPEVEQLLRSYGIPQLSLDSHVALTRKED